MVRDPVELTAVNSNCFAAVVVSLQEAHLGGGELKEVERCEDARDLPLSGAQLPTVSSVFVVAQFRAGIILSSGPESSLP